jgi:MFS family permease
MLLMDYIFTGAMLYIKNDFDLQDAPSMEGSIMAIGLVSAMIVTVISGVLVDRLGRRWMLLASAASFVIGAVLTNFVWDVYMLLFSRFIMGIGNSLTVTIVPLYIYISEIAPPSKRGLLNTLPQFSGSGGMFLSYCINFVMSHQYQILIGEQCFQFKQSLRSCTFY